MKQYHVQLRAFLERYQRFFNISNNDQVVKPDFLVSLVSGVDGMNLDINAEYDVSEIRPLDVDTHRAAPQAYRHMATGKAACHLHHTEGI